MGWSGQRRFLGGDVGIWVGICCPEEGIGVGGEGKEGTPDLDIIRLSRSFQKWARWY